MSRWWRAYDEAVGSEELDAPFSPCQLGPIAADVLEVASLAMTLAPLCESPIEVELGAHIMRSVRAPFELRPQFRMARYRFDFAIMVDAHAVMLIECDGKKFHSTPEQIANDRRKDMAAGAAGIRILRFTGSEIFHEPARCAARVISELGA